MLQRVLVAILALVLALAIQALGVFPNIRAVPTDYAQFYFAGELVARGQVSQIYDVNAYEPLTDAVKAQGFGLIASHYFNRPAFAALLCYPLAFFSYQTSSNLVVALNMMLWGLLVWKLPLWLNTPTGVRWWLISFLPFAMTVALTQETMLITLLVVYSCVVLMPRNQVAAGVLLSLCLVKPHVVLFLPVLFILERKWIALRSFLASGAVLALLSFALVGPTGTKQWLALLAAPTTDSLAPAMGNLRAIGINFGLPIAGALGVAVLLAGIAVLRYGGDRDRLSVLLILSLLLSPHTYWQDYSLTVIFALVTTAAFIRYSILLPWALFGPTNQMLDIWPSTFVLIACLIAHAVTLWWPYRTAERVSPAVFTSPGNSPTPNGERAREVQLIQ